MNNEEQRMGSSSGEGTGHAQLSWIAFPGLACPVADYDPVGRAAGMELTVVDQTRLPLTCAPEQLWDRLEIPEGKSVGLIGHSLGALTALNLALDHPDQVKRVVLVDPGLPQHTPMGDVLSSRQVENLMRRAIVAPVFGAVLAGGWALGKTIIDSYSVMRGGRRAIFLIRGSLGERLRYLGSVLASKAVRASLARSLARSWRYEDQLGDRLRKLPASGPSLSGKVVQIVGQRASAKVLQGQRRLAELTDSSLVRAARSGHLVLLTQPDLVAASLRT